MGDEFFEMLYFIFEDRVFKVADIIDKIESDELRLRKTLSPDFLAYGRGRLGMALGLALTRFYEEGSAFETRNGKISLSERKMPGNDEIFWALELDESTVPPRITEDAALETSQHEALNFLMSC
jgi:hypothetical protein